MAGQARSSLCAQLCPRSESCSVFQLIPLYLGHLLPRLTWAWGLGGSIVGGRLRESSLPSWGRVLMVVGFPTCLSAWQAWAGRGCLWARWRIPFSCL